MSDLTRTERRQLERHLQMASGYVLDFSNRTLEEFVEDSIGYNIYAEKYSGQGTSKANRLRAFWETEPNHVVGKLLGALLAYSRPAATNADGMALFSQCEATATRLQQSAPVEAIGAITPEGSEAGFEILARAVRDSIEHNRPEEGLDRLHTYVTKLIRTLSEKRGVVCDREKPLHSIFGEYVKTLRGAGLIESEMAERILKSSISTLEAFSHVRNNRSLAHDNPILGYDESLLIFNHVCSAVRFIRALETRAEPAHSAGEAEYSTDGEIPF